MFFEKLLRIFVPTEHAELLDVLLVLFNEVSLEEFQRECEQNVG